MVGDHGPVISLGRYRPGLYVRITLEKVPCEFIDCFDPHVPVIVGGLLPTEDTLGFMQVRRRPEKGGKGEQGTSGKRAGG